MTTRNTYRAVRAARLAFVATLAANLAFAALDARAVTWVSSYAFAGDSIPVTLTLDDVPGGDAVEITISIEEGQGDILGFFGNVTDESLVPQLDATGAYVVQEQYAANQVYKVGGGNEIAPITGWDWGLRLESPNWQTYWIHEATLQLHAPGLTVAHLINAANQGWYFAVRVQFTQGPKTVANIGFPATPPPPGDPATIVIAVPAEGAILAQNPVTVNGPLTGTPPIYARVNGIGGGVSVANDFFQRNLTLADGHHTIPAIAGNSYGFMRDEVSITVDTTPPVVAIATPGDGALTAASTVVVTGTASDATSGVASVVVNGVTATLDGTSYGAVVPVALGANTLTATATDFAGHASAPAAITVTRGVAPVVAITTPGAGFTTSAAEALVTGTVNGSEPIQVTVNGVTAAVAAGGFSATVPLAVGANTILATATNAFGAAFSEVAGERASGEIPLAISIESPPDGAVTSARFVPVSGHVSDGAAAVTVNGAAAIVAGAQYVVPVVELTEGPNTILARATRGAETAEDQVSVTYDPPPRVVITSPPDASTVRAASVDVEGVVDDLAAFVDVNGVVASVAAGGRFLARDVPLAPGANPLLARAIDLRGGIGTDQITVTRDEAAPPQLRLTFTSLDRYPFFIEAETVPAPILAKTVADFAAALAPLGFPANEFTPPITTIEATYGGHVAFVFAETASSVDLYSNGVLTQSEIPMTPIEELPNDFLFTFGDLEPERIPELLPIDLDAGYYTTLDLSILTDGFGADGLVDLEVVAADGGTASLSVDQDRTTPAVSILSPVSGSIVSGGAVTVTGTATDDGELFGRVRYEILDETFARIAQGWAPLVGGRFQVSEHPLASGPHCVVVTAFDAAGNNQGEITCVTIDPAAPIVQLVSPRDGEALLASQASLDLNFGAPATLVSINGVPDGRSFGAGLALDVATIPLSMGANTVALAVDAGQGLVTVAATLFRVASIDPIRIVSPSSGDLVNASTATIEVRVPLGTSSVTVNGIAATRGSGGAVFTASVPLAEGANSITATARPFGQSTEVELVRDTIPPSLSLLAPADGARLSAATGFVSGLVSEASDVRLIGPGVSRRSDTTARVRPRSAGGLIFGSVVEHVFEFDDVPYGAGSNAFTLRLTDRAGNARDVAFTHERLAGPALALVSPENGSNVSGLSTSLQLVAQTNVTIDAVYVAGRRLASFDGLALPSGASVLGNVPLVPGSNDIRIVYRVPAQSSEVLSASIATESTGIATLYGIVRDSKTGLPLGGALATVTQGETQVVTAAASDGSFGIAVPPGAYSIAFSREGFSTLTASGTAASGDSVEIAASLLPWTTGTATIIGLPAGAPASRASGTVRDQASGLALEGALVAATTAGGIRSAISDGAGQFVIEDIQPGPFEITVVRAGYFPRSYSIETSGPVEVDVDPALEPLPDFVTVLGIVESGLSGQPESGVYVRLLGSQNAAITDELGRFVLFGVPLGRQSLRFEKSGYIDHFFTVDVIPLPEGYPLELRFTYPVAIGFGGTIAIPPNAHGTVRDSMTDAPIPGAEVRIGATTVVADSEGHFTLSDLEPLTQIEVSATAPGWNPQTITALVVENGEDTLEFGLRAEQFGAIVGTIRDAITDAPVPFASVRVRGAPMLGAATARDGAYEIAGIAAGSYILDVVHPEYENASTAQLGVSELAATSADASLVPRPRTGHVTGRVTDSVTGQAIPGAQVSYSETVQDVTDSQGQYALAPVPAGMVTLAITAPGYPVTSKTLAVMADVSASTPRTTVADIAISTDGPAPDDVTATISATEGGSVATADGRMTLVFPPLTLTADARVTLRRPDPAPTSAGSMLELDAELSDEGVKAVGDGVEIVVESTTEGAVAPNVVGPVAVVARYRGSEIDDGNIAEDTLYPYYHDGTQWTAMRMVPYFHAVDRLNEIVLTAMNFSETETGTPIFAQLENDPPILLADTSGSIPPLNPVRTFVLWLAGAIAKLHPPGQPVAEFQDLRRLDPYADAIHPNALPLLIVHGWDPSSILFDSPLPSLPDRAGRYLGFIEDLLDESTSAGGKSVYRPVFLRYNSRLAIRDNAHALASKLRGRFFRADDEAIRGIVNPENPDSGKFSAVNAFGFSMGGLVSRAYACSSGHVRDLVTVGTPHVGALQSLVRGIERYVDPIFGFLFLPADVRIRDLMAQWSPGTADLLPDGDSTLNPTLAKMNSVPCYGPSREIQLVGGTDEKSIRSFFPDLDGATAQDVVDAAEDDAQLSGFLAQIRTIGQTLVEALEALGLGNLLSIGSIAVGEHPNDGVVPLRSAFAQTRGGSTVPALVGRVRATEREDFNHLDLGKASSPLSNFTRRSVFPGLSDWKVATILEFEPPTLPTQSEPGEAEVKLSIDYSFRRGDIKSIAVVWYGKDAGDDWHILQGADPETLKPDAPIELDGPSSKQEGEPQEVIDDLSIPSVDPDDPTTDLEAVTFLVVDVYSDETTVPEDPTEVSFGLPMVPPPP